MGFWLSYNGQKNSPRKWHLSKDLKNKENLAKRGEKGMLIEQRERAKALCHDECGGENTTVRVRNEEESGLRPLDMRGSILKGAI